MGELIEGESASYARYEELIAERDGVKKEALLYHRAYVREFGELILAVFEQKVACIRHKKSIEFCQTAINRGEKPDPRKLREYLEKETAEFSARLEQMANERASALKDGVVTEATVQLVKTLYRQLAKRLHPDLNPATEGSPVLMDLWNRAVVSYQGNDLKGLEEVATLADRALKESHLDSMELRIPDLSAKIAALEAEIKQIRETDPYQYKFLLADPGLVASKKKELRAEMESYRDHAARLAATLAALAPGRGPDGEAGPGDLWAWQMN